MSTLTEACCLVPIHYGGWLDGLSECENTLQKAYWSLYSVIIFQLSAWKSLRICTQYVSQQILHLQQKKMACRYSQVLIHFFQKTWNIYAAKKEKLRPTLSATCQKLSATHHVHMISSWTRILKIQCSQNSTHFSAEKKKKNKAWESAPILNIACHIFEYTSNL